MKEDNLERLNVCIGIKNGVLMSLPFWVLLIYWLM